MLEHQVKLILDGEADGSTRRFRHSQLVADVLGVADLDSHRYLIVEDDHGSILGVVETEELLQKVTSPDPVERRRWCDMPLESAISARLDSYSPPRRALPKLPAQTFREISGAAISTTDDDLAAIFLEDELYLRWSSVKQILQHALVDSVTGLPNRMVFERRLAEEWQRLERNASTLCVVLIDLDYFKNINDEHGHAIGDIVLKEIGMTLQRQFRSYDLLVRYGGDEFVAILTGCSASKLVIPIGRIQKGIQKLRISEHPGLPELSLSVGAVSIRSQSDIESMDRLIQEADTCLYRAKENGRNCAYIADLTNSDRTPKLVDQFADSGFLGASCENE